VTGINGNGDWGSVDGGLKSGFRTRLNIFESRNGGTNIGRVEFAGVGTSCCVWVRGFSVDTLVGDNVSESRVHQSSVASLVSLRSGAVNKILFGE